MTSRKLDPIDRDIIRVLAPLRRGVTPSQVADSIGIHPSTAKLRMLRLWRKRLLDCRRKGNRLICKVNSGELSRIRRLF